MGTFLDTSSQNLAVKLIIITHLHGFLISIGLETSDLRLVALYALGIGLLTG